MNLHHITQRTAEIGCAFRSNTPTRWRTHLFVVAKLDVHISVRAELAPHGAIHLGKVPRPNHSDAHRRRHVGSHRTRTAAAVVVAHRNAEGFLAFCVLEERLSATRLDFGSTCSRQTLSARFDL